MSIANQKTTRQPENPRNSLPSWINPMHSKELHHFCTVSSPIFATSGKTPVDYEPLTKLSAPRRSVPVVPVFARHARSLTNCTISAPFLHRFSHPSARHPLIINHLQNFLH